MKRAFVLTFILVVLSVLGVSAQNPVSWTLESESKGKPAVAGKTFKARLKATIEAPWHLYAIEQPDGGPIPTTITTTAPETFAIDGKIISPKPITKFDENFQIDTKFFAKEAWFDIVIKPLAAANVDDLALNVRYQVCTESNCLPPKTVKVTFAGTEDVKRYFDQPTVTNTDQPAANSGQQNNNQPPVDLWAFIWLAVTFGAISLLTPCVFPMIPITVSYFMKHSDGDRAKTIKLATVYSAGIIATFSLLGMLLAVAFGAAGINLFAANPWVNLAIGAIFLFFAFNLFGFYEITIPASVLTKLDKITRTEEGKGSAYLGALLMGLTFTLTSFTCTSPFIGTLLVSTAQGDWKMPLLGMLVFSTVFALPFFLLATVPKLLSSLPRSGGWLNSVKVVMGFLEIAAAMKFLSNVDLVWGAGFSSSGVLNYGKIFTREVVLIIWVALGLGIVTYILGLFKFKHDSPVNKITPLRIFFALVFLALCVYLTTGVFGRKLGELESFLPPKNKDSIFNVLGNRHEELQWISNNYEGALQRAKSENKHVFIDFTGYTCTNCRWMEANMFTQPAVKAEMEKFVLASLYTDGDGEIYAHQQQLEQDMFGTVALPFYAIVDANGKTIASFPGLTRSEDEFIGFLKQGQQ